MINQFQELEEQEQQVQSQDHLLVELVVVAEEQEILKAHLVEQLLMEVVQDQVLGLLDKTQHLEQ
jgi:hypothetical protein